MNFHIGKIYYLPPSAFSCKYNQPKLWLNHRYKTIDNFIKKCINTKNVNIYVEKNIKNKKIEMKKRTSSNNSWEIIKED